MMRLAIPALAICSIGLSAFAQSIVAGRKVSVVVVNPDDLSVAEWPGTGPAVSSVRAVATADDTIYSLLQANGIYPDSEAFTLVYDLNPALNNLKLGAGTSLELPRIAEQQDLSRLKAKGELARVSVDPELRRTLSERIGELQTLANSSSGLTTATAQSQLNTISAWYAQVDESYQRRIGPPLRRETLRQLVDEAAALNAILGTAAQTRKPVSADDEAQISAIHDDLAKVMANYAQVMGSNLPNAEKMCAVIVNIKGINSGQSDVLRVYYTFNGIYRDPPSDPPVRSGEWTQLGSGHSEKLLNDKTYKVWAAPDGDPGHPLTQPFRLDTACGNDQIPVDLSVMTRVH